MKGLAKGWEILVLGAMFMAFFEPAQAQSKVWASRAAEAQTVLVQSFWDKPAGIFESRAPTRTANLNYWWQAHAIDTLLDAYTRDQNPVHLQRADSNFRATRGKQGGILNDFYDDEEWMALALLRLWDATKRDEYKTAVAQLWNDIQGGWNTEQGGGIAWRKSQRDYKNTPANAPAAILAARLYQRFGNPADLEWAQRIWGWLAANLLDPQTGIVWDGKNRQGDGQIDKGWIFTYNQGTVIGAAVELWRATGKAEYLDQAERVLDAALGRLAPTGLLVDEKGGDGGLFKGILVRYMVLLAEAGRRRPQITSFLQANAQAAWAHRNPQGLFGSSWSQVPLGDTDLSVHLSGVMLMEGVARLEAKWPPDHSKQC